MSLLEAYLPLLMAMIPFIGSLFIGLVPTYDTSSIKQIALVPMFILLFLVGLAAYSLQYAPLISFNSTLLSTWDKEVTFFLDINRFYLASIFCLVFSSLLVFLFQPKEDTQNKHFSVVFLTIIALLTTSILIRSLVISTVILHLSTWLFLYLLGLTQSTRRGTAIFTMGSFFVIIDVLCICFLTLKNNAILQGDWLVQLALALPYLSRLLILVLSPWFHAVTEELPWQMHVLYLGGFVPTSLVLYTQMCTQTKASETYVVAISILAGASALLTSLKVFASYSLRQFYTRAFGIFSTLFLLCAASHPSPNQQLTTFLLIACFCLIFGIISQQVLFQGALDVPESKLLTATFVILIGIPGVGVGALQWEILKNHLNQYLSVYWPFGISLYMWLFALLIYFICIGKMLLHIIPTAKSSFYPVLSSFRLTVILLWSYFALVLLISYFLPVFLLTPLNKGALP